MVKLKPWHFAIPLLIAACSQDVKDLGTTIQPAPSSYMRYEKGYAAGIKDIVKNARTARQEDAWFFDGNCWYDVGYFPRSFVSGLDLSTSINLGKIGSIILANSPSTRVLVHNHPIFGHILFTPPSSEDLKQKLSRGGLEDKVVDGGGVWEYSWINPPHTKEELEHVLNEYSRAYYPFVKEQISGKKFNFHDAYKTLKDKAFRLGIGINYKSIEAFN